MVKGNRHKYFHNTNYKTMKNYPSQVSVHLDLIASLHASGFKYLMLMCCCDSYVLMPFRTNSVKTEKMLPIESARSFFNNYDGDVVLNDFYDLTHCVLYEL